VRGSQRQHPTFPHDMPVGAQISKSVHISSDMKEPEHLLSTSRFAFTSGSLYALSLSHAQGKTGLIRQNKCTGRSVRNVVSHFSSLSHSHFSTGSRQQSNARLQREQHSVRACCNNREETLSSSAILYVALSPRFNAAPIMQPLVFLRFLSRALD
jgi:hypothetical protein